MTLHHKNACLLSRVELLDKATFSHGSSPVECLRTLSEPFSREPFKSPSDLDDFISLCLSLLFTCRYWKHRKSERVKKENRLSRGREDSITSLFNYITV